MPKVRTLESLKATKAVYEKRRKKYQKILKDCSKKIKCINDVLRKKESRAINLNKFKNKVIEFFGEIPQKRSVYEHLVCKFALENHLTAKSVATWLKYKDYDTIAKRRKDCTELLKIRENKELWEDLKNHLKM